MSQLAVKESNIDLNLLTHDQEDENKFLTFNLTGDIFGINILVIKEILEYGEITHIPMVPDYIRGVINLRGSVVPVIDLASRINGTQAPVDRRTCIVIIEVEHDERTIDIGVVVDAVSEVLHISKENIEPAPSFGAKIRTDFISGMGKIKEKFVVLLNVASVLSIDELAGLSQIGNSSSHDKQSN